MHRYARICAGIAACLALLSCATPPPPAAPEIWPTAGWPVSTPEAQGIDSAALGDAIQALRAKGVPIHSLLIERNGYIVLDTYFFPYADNEPHDVASITKSVTSTLVGIAQNENALADLNAPLPTLIPGQMALDPRRDQITLAQLLSMTSGFDCSSLQGRSLLAQMEGSPHWSDFMMARPLAADPGSVFLYCAGNMQLVSAALTHATGESAFALAREKLFAPLGIVDATWPADPDGNSHGFADLMLKPRDLAKLGYLWLHGGQWGQTQLVSKSYLEAALSPHVTVQPGIQYGYGMWLYPGHTPFDFEANGRGGQRITVIPSWNTVIVVTAGGMDANVVTPLIEQAFKANGALPENPAAQQRLAQIESQAAASPAFATSAGLAPATNAIADKTYYMPANPLGIRSLLLTFPQGGDPIVQFGFADGTVEAHVIGTNGTPKLSANLRSGLPVAVAGRWDGTAFILDYDEIARINAYRLVLTPDVAGLQIHLTERSGLADMVLTAGTTPPEQQRIAGVTGSHG